MENPVLEPRAERIARYKAERRRELAERFGTMEELPSKWVRRDGREGREGGHEASARAHRLSLNSDGFSERVNGKTQEVTNGIETEAPAEANHLKQGCQDSANMPSVEGSCDGPQLRTRVSVGQLRSALLQQTETGAQPEKVGPDAGWATSSLDLAVKSGSDVGRRRTRRYLPGGGSGGSRKTSERFRTQPITANEMEESSGLLDAEEEENSKADEKTDDRAKMSVAAKMSLFKELERSAAPEASALLKPRSASVCHERRTRRGNDHRFLTQPITCEEMVAISAPKPAAPAEAPTEEDDESCKLSVSEKLALFNKLSLPGKQGPGAGAGAGDGAPERRRQKGARYRTQPITVEEVSLLQKGPVQLPAFRLSAHLSDRQQDSSVNLKPSEVRLSQPRRDSGSDPGSVTTEPPTQQQASEPGLKGILKKSHSAGSEGASTDSPLGYELNGDGCAEVAAHRRPEDYERSEICAPPRRQRREATGVAGGSMSAAPWRQRARNRRETIACTPMRTSTVFDGPQEEKLGQDEPQGEIHGTVGNSYSPDSTGRVRQEEEQVGVRRMEEETTGCVHETRKEQSEKSQCWEPVFASVFSSSTPQYIMCFNQTSLSFEAQEVSSPTKNIQPQWRQKVKGGDVELIEVEETSPQQETKDQESGDSTTRSLEFLEEDRNDISRLSSEALTCSYEAAPQEVEEETDESRASDGGFCLRASPPAACLPPPCGGVTTSEGEQDLDVLCQTNAPILTSAVAEHRRSVRPSRRTQGSRNPLRALAAREDVRQDYMGERVNAEERVQAENQRKNSSVADSPPVQSEDSIASFPPFSSLMLIHIKGRRSVQVRLVEPSSRSLNSGDCFLLVTPQLCITWSGEFASQQEKSKALELASFIQSQKDLGCSASQVLRLEEGLNCESAEAADFWSVLGGRAQYRGAGPAEEDEQFEVGVVESNCVYRLVENRLVPHEQAWASAPSNALLDPAEALVFDFGSEVYLWHGRDVPQWRVNVALQLTQQVWLGAYDYSNCGVNPLDPTQTNPSVPPRGEGRPGWALFAVLSEHNQTALFREKFLDRTSCGGAQEETDGGRQEPSSPPPHLLVPCDATFLVTGRNPERDGPVRAVLGGLDVQRGHGVITLEDGGRAELRTAAVDTWHVQEFDDSEVAVESTGQLHEGDSYVIRWTYSIQTSGDADSSDECVKDNTVFFLWRGRHSSVSGRDTAAFLSIGINSHQESQVVVPQGEEPPCFLQLFHGGLVIHRGKREEDASTNAAWRLFCVRGELPEEAQLLEVECCCASLRSRGSVVLLNSQQGALYLWTGCKAQSSIREVSRRAAERLTDMCPPELGLSQSSSLKVEVVDEGSEPAEFWTALGQMDRKAYDCMLQDPGKYNFTPRLFHMAVSSGSFRAEELRSPTRLPGLVMAMPFVQERLYSAPQPALFLLDNRLEVYLWQRGEPAESSSSSRSLWRHERECALQTVLSYCREMNPRRPPLAYLILEGAEPLTFTNVFPRWERSLGPHTQDDTGRAKLTLVQDALAQLMKTQYPVEELLRSPLPEGVDPQHLEVYLSDQDFQAILEMKRDEYASLPSCKQIDLKKSKGLFS